MKKIAQPDAINLVGRTLYGEIWIGKLSRSEQQILMAHGPQVVSANVVGAGETKITTIEPCPLGKVARLERALGRVEHMAFQRNAALDWLERRGFLSTAKVYDREKLVTALAAPAMISNGRRPGAPPDKRRAVANKMIIAVRSGRTELEKLRTMKQTMLVTDFGPASRGCCVEARKLALLELQTERTRV